MRSRLDQILDCGVEWRPRGPTNRFTIPLVGSTRAAELQGMFIMEERLTSVPCVICGKPVRLEDCKINDLGEPVHEACLAERLQDESKRQESAYTH